MKISFSILLLMMLLTLTVRGQNEPRDSTVQYRIETRDGNEYIGFVLEEDTDKLTVKTRSIGIITLRKSDVKRITTIDTKHLVNGEYWFDNPQSTRYFWQPNAYGLKKGEGYYQNVWILFNQASIGLTDNLSVGAGIMPLFLFAGAPTPVWITPKVSIPVKRDKFNISAGALVGTVLGEDNADFGIAYSTITFGSRDKNVSMGGGYGYRGGDWASAPAFTLSAMVRTGKRGYFMTETYYMNAADGDIFLMFLGGRRMIKNSGIDFGVLIPSNDGYVILIPWLGVTFPLGKALQNKKPK